MAQFILEIEYPQIFRANLAQVGTNLFDRADALISAFGSRAVESVGDSQAYAGARRNLAVNIEAGFVEPSNEGE